MIRRLFVPCSWKVYESAGTRGHPFKLYKKTVLTNQYAHFFTNRVINDWNSLPSNIVLAGTLNSFKTLLYYKHWKQNIYIYMVQGNWWKQGRSIYTALRKKEENKIMLSIIWTKTWINRQKAKKPTSFNLIWSAMICVCLILIDMLLLCESINQCVILCLFTARWC